MKKWQVQWGMQWETVRAGLLAVLLGAGGVAIAKVAVFGSRETFAFPTYTLPEQVTPSNWQFRQSHVTNAHVTRGPAFVTSVDDQAIAARRYQYNRNNMPLEVEVRYFVKTYRHVPALIEDSTLLSIRPALRDRTHPKIGPYLLYAHQGKIHLSTCLDPYGRSFVYDSQVSLSQTRPEILARRAFPWLLGQAPLRDLRCLWVDLAMPLQATGRGPLDLDRVDPKPLEDAFVEWVAWWQENYPPEPPRN